MNEDLLQLACLSLRSIEAIAEARDMRHAADAGETTPENAEQSYEDAADQLELVVQRFQGELRDMLGGAIHMQAADRRERLTGVEYRGNGGDAA